MQNYYRKMKVGKFMGKVISIGNQEFDTIREKECFFVDKTNFIKEWWENEDIITLITRPRRFGKTLNMSMMESFTCKWIFEGGGGFLSD